MGNKNKKGMRSKGQKKKKNRQNVKKALGQMTHSAPPTPPPPSSTPGMGAHSLTPDEYLARHQQYLEETVNRTFEVPRSTAEVINSNNVDNVLNRLNVVEEARPTTAKALKSLSALPGLTVEAVDGRILATSGGKQVFEMPVFQGDNILTKGGNRWSSVGGVNEFNAAGEGSFSSFFDWFNNTIEKMASNTGVDPETRRMNLRREVSHIFGQYAADGDGGRSLVEPLSSSGRWKPAHAVAKSRTHAVVFDKDSPVLRLAQNVDDAVQKRLAAASSGGLAAAIKHERMAMEKFTQSLFSTAGIVPGKESTYSDVIFSATKTGVVKPVIDNSGRLHAQLSTIQPRDLMPFSDDSSAAKGFSQLRHSRWITHDDMRKAGAATADSRAGLPSAIKANRIAPVIQTKERFEWAQDVSKQRGKAGTFQPMGRVAEFVDPEFAAMMLKDSSGMRNRGSYITDPNLSTMGETYTRTMQIHSDDVNTIKGMFNKNVEEAIEHQLKLRKGRTSAQTLEFGTSAGKDALGITLEGEGNKIIGINKTTTTPEGVPLPEELSSRAVQLEREGDVIEGIKVKDGQIEFSIRRPRHGGSIAGSLVVGEKRITAGRQLDLSLSKGKSIDILADLGTFENSGDGKFNIKTGEQFHSKGGDFYRRQLQTMGVRVEQEYGNKGLKAMAKAFGFEYNDSQFKKAPSLIVDPDKLEKAGKTSFLEGLEKFKLEVQTLEKGIGGTRTTDEIVKAVSGVEIDTFSDDVMKGFLREAGVIEGSGSWNTTIYNAKTNTRFQLSSDEGQKLFKAYQQRGSVAIFTDVVVERVDRVANAGIKPDGKSSAQMRASRMAYIKETLWTRAGEATNDRTKAAINSYEKLINKGLIQSNELVFDELVRMASPLRPNGAIQDMAGDTVQNFRSNFGSKIPDVAGNRSATGAVEAHALVGSPYYDEAEHGLRKTGSYIELGHRVDVTGGTHSGGADDLLPKSAKASKLYIPSPAAVLNQDATKSIFMPGGNSSQAAYIELVEHITKLGEQSGPLSKDQADSVAKLYGTFATRFAKDMHGKGKPIANAALNPTMARYGGLSSLPNLQGDSIAITNESFEEMLRKSSYSDAIKDELRRRVKEGGGGLKVGFLADPMSTREHYRATQLNVVPDDFVDNPTYHAGGRAKGVRATGKDLIYISDAMATMMNRDFDADHGVISLLSSISENVVENAEQTEADVLHMLNQEQEALDALHGEQKGAIGLIEDAKRADFRGTLTDALEHGTSAADVGLDKAGPIVGSKVGALQAGKMTAASTSPASLTPVPEVWWNKVSGLTERVHQHRARATSWQTAASVTSEIVEDIMSKSQVSSSTIRQEVTALVEAMTTSTSGASRFHVAIKYAMLQKEANQSSGKQAASLQYWDDLEAAVKTYSKSNMAGELATAELDGLTKSIMDVMAGGEYVDGFDPARAKHPVGIKPGEGVEQFARNVAREIVAAEVIQKKTGFVNPSDIVTKNTSTLIGEQTDPNAAPRRGDARLARGGGDVAELGSVQEQIMEQPRSTPLHQELADRATYEAQEAARVANAAVEPRPTGAPGEITPGNPSQPRPNAQAQSNVTKELIEEWVVGIREGVVDKWHTSKGFKYGVVAAAGVAAYEMVRSTVSATIGAFQGPDISTPTAPMPPSPNLDQPMGSTFDSRMLPQHNRTRVQRPQGMRTHTSISAQSDMPIDFSGMPGASLGNYSTGQMTNGQVRDSRSSRSSMEQEARRRLYAAY